MVSTPLEDSANVVVLKGTLVAPVQIRYSPADIPIARFLLAHGSEQTEAGACRHIRFRVGVRASGGVLTETLRDLPVGAQLRVVGFLSRARQFNEEYPLILCASRIERLAL